MFLCALVIPLSIECALREALPAEPPPDAASTHGSGGPELDSWPTLIQLQPDEQAALRARVAEALGRPQRAAAPVTGRIGERYPMRIYICDAAGPRREVIASPEVYVIPATAADR